MKAAQDEASPAALRRKAPEAQVLMLAERKGMLRWYLSEAHDAGSARSCNGREEAVTAIGELTKSSKNLFLSVLLLDAYCRPPIRAAHG